MTVILIVVALGAALGLLLLTAVQIELMRLRRFLATTWSDATPALEPGDILKVENLVAYQRIGRRIFSQEDWNFVGRHPAQVRDLFLKQRQVLALQWLEEGRRRIRSLMRMHRMATRSNASLVPQQEIRLAANYLLFRALSAMACLVTLLWGPFVLRTLVDRLLNNGSRISSLLPDLATSIARENAERV